MEPNAQSKLKRYVSLFLLAIILTVAHLLYNWYFGYRLFELRGGVQKMRSGRAQLDGIDRSTANGSVAVELGPNGWTSSGGIDRAWTCPIYLPGCAIFKIGDRLHGPRPAPQPYGQIGGFLILAGSLVAGWVVASLIVAVFGREKPVLGKYLWRLWLLLFAWGWVLVPAELSWVYQWTVIY
jgi:hypothetical protein